MLAPHYLPRPLNAAIARNSSFYLWINASFCSSSTSSGPFSFPNILKVPRGKFKMHICNVQIQILPLGETFPVICFCRWNISRNCFTYKLQRLSIMITIINPILQRSQKASAFIISRTDWHVGIIAAGCCPAPRLLWNFPQNNCSARKPRTMEAQYPGSSPSFVNFRNYSVNAINPTREWAMHYRIFKIYEKRGRLFPDDSGSQLNQMWLHAG